MVVRKSQLGRGGITLALLTGFSGTLWLTVSLGPIHLFPFRVIILLLLFLFLNDLARIKASQIKVYWPLGFFVFWFFYACFSLMWAADFVSGIKHVVFLFLNTSLILFTVVYINRISDFKKLFNIWLAIFVLLLPVGFWEVITGEHLSNSGLLNVDEGLEELYKFAPTTVFGNQNDYATLISMSFPMLYVSIRYSKSSLSKFLLFIVSIASALMLVFTTSRANYIGVILAFLFWVFVLLSNKGRGVIVIIALLFLVIFSFQSDEISFWTDIWDDLSSVQNADDAGVDIRSNLIKNGIYYGVMTFGLGVGAGNIEHYIAHKPIYFVGDITNVHNWWVEVFANYGIVIFLGYIIFYFWLFITLFRMHKGLQNVKEKIVCEVFLCGLIAFPISSISSSSIIAFNPHWIYFGLALAFINYIRLEKVKLRCTS